MLQLFLDGRITAVDVVDALDIGAPIGNQRGQNQAGRGTQIRGHHRCAIGTNPEIEPRPQIALQVPLRASMLPVSIRRSRPRRRQRIRQHAHPCRIDIGPGQQASARMTAHCGHQLRMFDRVAQMRGELTLRVKSVLRRGQEKAAPDERLTLGELTLDRSRHEVVIKGRRIDLTATEFKLLAVLMERRGRVQGRERLLNDVWGYESVIDTRTVDTHVRRLREKLGDVASYIETVRGVGYRISETAAA